MVQQNTDFGRVADDLRRAATSFALLTSQATLLGQALRSFREFERQITLTGAIANATAAEFRQLSNAANNFSLATTATAVEAGQALQNLAQAGFDTQESIAGLTGVLLLAGATLTDVGTASDVLSSNIRAFGLETSDATRVSNLFVAAQNSSLATVEKLTFALRQVGPVAEVAGLSIEETTAFLGELFNIGLRGEQAGTSLRNVIIRLSRPTGEAAEILREFGIATLDATGNFRGLEAVLRDIGQANLGTAQIVRLFEAEAAAGALALIEAVAEGADGAASSYENLLNKISGTDAALIQNFKLLDTLDGQLRLLQNSLNASARIIGEELAPFIRELALGIREISAQFQSLDDEQQAQIARWAAISFAVVGVLASINALVLVFSGFVGSIVKVAGGLTTLGGALLGVQASALTLSGAFAALRAAVTGAGFASLLPLIGSFGAGVGAIAAVIGGVAFAFGAFRDEATDAIQDVRDELAGLNDIEVDIDFIGPLNREGRLARGQSIAQSVLDAVGTDTAIAEAQQRIRLAEDLINNDLIRLIATEDIGQAIAAANTAQEVLADQVQSLTNQRFDITEQLAARFEREDPAALDNAILGIQNTQEKVRELAAAVEELGFLGGFEDTIRNIQGFGPADTLDRRLEAARESLEAQLEGLGDTEFQAAVITAIAELDEIAAERERTLQVLADARQRDFDSVRQFIQELGETGEGLTNAYDEFTEVIVQAIDADTEASENLRNRLQSIIDDPEQRQILSKEEIEEIQRVISGGNLINVLSRIFALEDATQQEQVLTILQEAARQGVLSDADAEVLIRLVETAEDRERIIRVFGTLNEANDTLKEIIERQGIEIAQGRLDAAETLAEVVEAANDLFIANVADAFDEFADRVGQDVLDTFGQVGVPDIDFATIYDEFADSFDFTDNPDFNDIISFRFFSDQLTEALEGVDNAEDAQRIANQLVAEYLELFNQVIDRFLAAFPEGLPQPLLDSIAQFRELAATALANIVTVEIDDFEDNLQRGTDRVNRANRATNKVPDAVKALREFEDQINDLRDASRDAARTLAEVGVGLEVNVRAELLRQLDIADIVDRYEDDLRKLRRAQEDLARNTNIEESQRDELNRQYEETIAIIEAAKQAEIEATNSFTAQMQRRSEALDAYIEDLRTAAQAGEISQAAAGAQIAIAEFNRDLITVADIWQDAVTTGIESISSSLADAIFEGEDLLEAFKKTALDISRQVFEAFTNRFLQDLLGNLVPGLGDALNPEQAQAQAQVQQIAAAAQSAAQAITTGGQTAGQAFQAGAQGVQQGGQQTTTALQTTGQGISTSGQQVVATLQSIAGALQGVLAQFNGLGLSGTGTVGSLFSGAADRIASGVAPVLRQFEAIGGGVQGLLDFIRVAETGSGSFDTISSFSKITPEELFGRSLTQLNLGEVFQLQAKNLSLGAESSAVGGFQILKGTLEGLVDKLNIPLDTQFDANLQNRLGLELLREDGLNSFLTGGISPEEFGERVAGTWAAIPNPFTGQSNYEGDGLNSATVGLDEFLGRLNGLNSDLAEVGPTILGNLEGNLPTADQFTQIFAEAFGSGGRFEELGGFINFEPAGVSLADGFQAGDVISSAFNPGDLSAGATAQLQATIAQLNAALQAGGQQLQVSLQQVASQTSTGGQQVQLALTQTGVQTRNGGVQLSTGLQQTGQSVTTNGQQVGVALNQTAATIQGANAQIAASAGGIGSSLISSFTSPSFLTGLLGYIPLFFKEGGMVDLSAVQRFAGGGEVMPSNIYNFVKNYNEGGSVFGPGTGTSDDILAFLSNGEFVINARDTSNYRNVLEAINSGASYQEVIRALVREQGGNLQEIFGRNIERRAAGGLVGGGFGDADGSVLGNFKDFGFLGSQVEPVQSNINSGNTSMAPVYNITIQANDARSAEKAAESFRRSASQHAKDLGRFIERAKRNS